MAKRNTRKLLILDSARKIRSYSIWHFVLLSFWTLNLASPLRAQMGRGDTDESTFRGNRAEISITLKDNSGQVITAPATVKLYHMGALAGQSAASKGRAFFILNSLGDYTISVDASGYKPVQKDISFSMPINDVEDIVLQRDSGSNEAVGNGSGPLMAPKAKEAYGETGPGRKVFGRSRQARAEPPRHFVHARRALFETKTF